MIPASWLRDDVRLVANGGVHAYRELPELLEPGDLVVVNDAATLPASLRGDGVELRLVSTDPWRAIVFGAGDWHTATEDRPRREVHVGEVLDVGFPVTVTCVLHPRLVELAPLPWDSLYREGRPIQYRYLERELPLWGAQTPWATRPWAVETPSAGRPLTYGMLRRLRERGIEVATLTEAAGISSTGDPELDALLPFPERYEVPTETLNRARVAHRVVAIGTSVVRALESAARGPSEGITNLHLDGTSPLLLVHGLVTGLHEPGTSHRRLVDAFGARPIPDGLYGHEHGDMQLLFRG